MPEQIDPRRVAAYEEALYAIARHTVACRATVRGFTMPLEAAQKLLVECEAALTGLVALGLVPGSPSALEAAASDLTVPTKADVRRMLTQVARDRAGSTYWRAHPDHLDAAEDWLRSLLDWLPE